MLLTVSARKEQEGSYACKIQAEIHVEQGELFQKTELTAAVGQACIIPQGHPGLT